MVDDYKEAGVDIAKADRLVDWLRSSTPSAGDNPAGRVVSGIGGFAALYELNWSRFRDPLLVSATDGVGTKLLLALEQDALSNVGIDCVAMCVNDLYCVGATPLFFLDYFATSELDEDHFRQVLAGIKSGLDQCGAALLGGETAELPGLMTTGHFDIAGFMVGVVERDRMLTTDQVRAGDVVLAIPSRGFHSNGFSLIRKWLAERPASAATLQRLLEPTAIYTQVPGLVELPERPVHALAHITGGGLSGNLARVLPDHVQATLSWSQIPTPDWMAEFFATHGTEPAAVEKTFNLGVGMVAIVDATAATTVAAQLGAGTCQIGVIDQRTAAEPVHFIS